MRRSRLLLLVPALLAAGCDKASTSGGQGGAANGAASAGAANTAASPDEVAPAAAPTATVAGAIDRSHVGTPAPAFSFADPSGKTITLASLRGKPVLLNLWATWCGPCVKELPTLNALAARAGSKLVVVTLSQDTDAGKAKAFLATRTLPHLGAYTDPATHWLMSGNASLPTSIYYGADGKEQWRAIGDRDWTDAASAKALNL